MSDIEYRLSEVEEILTTTDLDLVEIGVNNGGTLESTFVDIQNFKNSIVVPGHRIENHEDTIATSLEINELINSSITDLHTHDTSHKIGVVTDSIATGITLSMLVTGGTVDSLHWHISPPHNIIDHIDSNINATQLLPLVSGGIITAHTHSFPNHRIQDHSDTLATGPQLNILKGGPTSSADTLHKHNVVKVHTIVSHSDTSATGTQLNSLTNNNNVDTLHKHNYNQIIGAPGSSDLPTGALIPFPVKGQPTTFARCQGELATKTCYSTLYNLLKDNGNYCIYGEQDIGGKALYFNGINAYSTTPYNTDWDFFQKTTDTWTIDFWVKHPTADGQFGYFGQTPMVGGPGIGPTQLVFCHGGSGGLYFGAVEYTYTLPETWTVWMPAVGATITDTNWHHIAIVRTGSPMNNGYAWVLFLDGTMVYNTTQTDNRVYVAPLEFGRFLDYVGMHYYNLWIAEFHITNKALWTSAFTPGCRHLLDGKTKLLMHFDDSIVDCSDSPHAITNNNSYLNGDGPLNNLFKLPDYRGAFLRGWNHSSGIDPDSLTRTTSFTPFTLTGDTTLNSDIINNITTSRLSTGFSITGTNIPNNTTVMLILSPTSIQITNNATGTQSGVTLTFSLTGNNVGTVQNYDILSHIHSLEYTSFVATDTLSAYNENLANGDGYPTILRIPTYYSGGNETRPKNINTVLCIKT